MIPLLIWVILELSRLTRPNDPPPTAGVPKGEVPKNVRPWTPPPPDECPPPKKKYPTPPEPETP